MRLRVNKIVVDPAPFAPPSNGRTVEVAPGVLWLRLALPFRLNHVNVYLIDGDGGWLLIDTGPGNPATLAVWAALLDAGPGGPLRGQPITRLLVTHHHPDHVGAAAFLTARTGAPLVMGDTEYLTALALLRDDGAEDRERRSGFYRLHGLAGTELDATAGHLAGYRALVPALPPTFVSLRDRETVRFGGRSLQVFDAPGHAPAQMILHQADANLLFVADQVLTRITPNVSVTDRTPDDDPLQRFLGSLARLRAAVRDGGLVLPGHHLPFRTLHGRIAELLAHHEERCAAIEAACGSGKGVTVAELVPKLFPFALDPHQSWFAFSEVLAHLNYLAGRGRVEWWDSHGRRRWGQVGRASHGTQRPIEENASEKPVDGDLQFNSE